MGEIGEGMTVPTKQIRACHYYLLYQNFLTVTRKNYITESLKKRILALLWEDNFKFKIISARDNHHGYSQVNIPAEYNEYRLCMQ